MRLADYTIDFLVNIGVKNIFLVTGRGILFLTDAVAKNNNINHFSMHHEQSCSFAAIADANINNGVGCCLVSTGCASTNAITGVLNAYQDNIPVIFISGNNMLEETTYYNDINIKTYGSQELNIIPIVKSITKYATMITDANDIAYELEKAYYIANNGIKGPVWIDIPLNIQNAIIDENNIKHFDKTSDVAYNFNNNIFTDVVDSIYNAKRPIFLIGSGLKNSNSVSEFIELINKTDIPFVYTPSAVDLVSSELKQNIGCVSSLGGSREGNFAIQNSDLIIVLGSRMQSITTGGKQDSFGRFAKKIIVEINENELKKHNINYDIVLNTDIKLFINYLLKNLKYKTDELWLNKCIHWKNNLSLCNNNYNDNDKIDLYYLSKIISENIRESDCVITDAGFEELILPSNIRFKENTRCIHPVSQGSMGFALPASIGVSVNQKYNTYAIIGDGSIMMNLQELQTIKTYNLNVKIIIINNNNYAVIRKRQKDLFRKRIIGTDIDNGVSTPNWENIANCFGIDYIKINNNLELKNRFEEISNHNKTLICELLCDENQKYLHTSIYKTDNNKFLRRPMEDQSPFLDRDFIKSELLIPYEE